MKKLLYIFVGVILANPLPAKDLDKFYSGEKFGCSVYEDSSIFKLFAPRALKVQLEITSQPFAEPDTIIFLQADGQMVWKTTVPFNMTGKYYGYRVYGPQGTDEQFDPSILLPDPYSPAIVSRNEFHHRSMTYMVDETFNWENDTPLKYDYRDLIICEAHIRDITADLSSGLPDSLRGTYMGLCAGGYNGGLDYFTKMGYNAVELLPSQEYGNIEIPYQVDVEGVTNAWNPYAYNHWGYMTSNFFAPESYYAVGGDMTPGGISGSGGRAVHEFKQMVKEFHRNGIAVIMDVVYNHVSQYDYNPLKYIDKKYYFQLDNNGNYLGYSGCGNDFNTSRPMARKLIIDSLKKWVSDYHVDGFRFDIAAMIDWETIDAIREELTAVNPHIILIAEPWGGGGYWPEKFSEHNYAAWNDMFRNGVKGPNPENEKGLLFGNKWKNTYFEQMMLGCPVSMGGLFQNASHSVNYLESHDDYTLGDFIRIASGAVKPDAVITDILANNRLDVWQIDYNALAAMTLLVTQGPIMIAEGQEYGRSKVIAPASAPDKNIGRIDHNSYEKDNKTNWIDYDLREDNRVLVDFYRTLINFRKKYDALRYAPAEDYRFFAGDVDLSYGFELKDKRGKIIALFNYNQVEPAKFEIPKGEYHEMIWTNEGIIVEKGKAVLPPVSGILLVK